MFGLGMPELMIILVLCLLIFGPGKLPQLGSSLGGALKGFRRAVDEPQRIEKPEQNSTSSTHTT